jgi:hypothetical protein
LVLGEVAGDGFAADVAGMPFSREVTAEPVGDGMFAAGRGDTNASVKGLDYSEM